MLAYAWDGVPLPVGHGFPLRIYIPDVYGMKQPKWIESIEATDHWEPGYWVVRGWDKVARMKATSVIDTVGMNMKIIYADRGTLVPIGGIAHAGARGISKVEVRVDDGPWQQAALRTPLSEADLGALALRLALPAGRAHLHRPLLRRAAPPPRSSPPPLPSPPAPPACTA